ncbi:MAG TPA: hypothetical protein VMV49_05015 [Candidatus Deferrimicrobium sp.]|nr:hypothetical protein [Candidatus Deferrimicrobium sp.]
MQKEEIIIEWLHNIFLKNWDDLLKINGNFNDHKLLSYEKRKIFFPFIPIETDGYSLRNFIALILKYLFNFNSNSFIIILYNNNNSIVWAAFQKTDSYSFTELIELNTSRIDLNSILETQNSQAQLLYLQNLLEELKINSPIDFSLLLNIDVVSEFKEIYESHSNLLEFYSQIWDLMARHFNKHTLRFNPEPPFFKFLRRLSTKNVILNASEFQKLFGNLLPHQNIIINFLDKEFNSAFAIISAQNYLQIQFLNYDFLINYIARYENEHEKGLEYLNKIIKTTTPVLINNRRVEVTAAITLTEDIWLMIQDIMSQYRFEYIFDRIFEMTQDVEDTWTLEKKFVLFRHLGKSFMGFQLQRLISNQLSLLLTSILRLQNELTTHTLWFIVNDSLELIYMLEIDFKQGTFDRLSMISDSQVFKLFNSEPDKTLGIKKVHLHFAENGCWFNQMVVITTQDLNLLITFLPQLTTIKGSLKYLNIIENIITYRMYFYPSNFFADLISRKGATYFFKNILFPIILSNPRSK